MGGHRIRRQPLAVARATGIVLPKGFPAQPIAVRIPPHTHVSLLLDNQLEITAYPSLVVSGGRDTHIKMSYAEALLATEKDHPYTWHKGQRDQTDGKQLYGVYDAFIPDGGHDRVFTPLWMRVLQHPIRPAISWLLTRKMLKRKHRKSPHGRFVYHKRLAMGEGGQVKALVTHTTHPGLSYL